METQSMTCFDIRLWRNIVNYASEDLAVTCGAPVQAISPFGFEVFRDERFLWKKLRRLYCYLGSKDVSIHDLPTIENLFVDALHARLSDHWPDMAQQIIAYKTRSTIQWVRASDTPISENDRMVSISCRSTPDVLDAYSRYIICTLGGLCTETLPELGEFAYDEMARNRVFQLYLMEEEIFRSLMHPLTREEEQLRRGLFHQDNRIDFALLRTPSPPASSGEWHVLLNLVLPRLRLMKETVRGKTMSDLEILIAPVFHGAGEISVEISRAVGETALHFVRTSYLDFERIGESGRFCSDEALTPAKRVAA
jgi:hypothetical protein